MAAPALKPDDLMPGGGRGEVDCAVKKVVCALRKALGSGVRERAAELAEEVSGEVSVKRERERERRGCCVL